MMSAAAIDSRMVPITLTSILYSAAWQGNPTDVFTARPEAPESRSMGLSHTQLMSVRKLSMF